MRSLFRLIVCLAILTVHSLSSAQEKDRGPIAESTQYINLMKTPAIQEELQLVDYQLEELEKTSLRRKALMGAVLPHIEQMPSNERQPALKKLQEDLTTIESETYSKLLPFQKVRLDQIAKQVQIRASDSTAGLTHYRMVATLGLTEAQLESIREKAATVDAKLQEKLEHLRKEIEAEKDKARGEVLSLLTEQQRKDYHAMIGPIVDLSLPKQPLRPPPGALVKPQR